MHIPQQLLHGNICPVTLTVGALGVLAAGYGCRKTNDNVSPARWAGITALIFSLQMLNFPVTNGTSGHLIGGVLAASLLGIPRAILSIAMVLLTQALFFADGGLDALGANIINMGLIGAGLGGVLLSVLKKKGISNNQAIATASIVSILAAAFACTLEVSLSGSIAFGKMFKAMMPVHGLIGIGEAVITVSLIALLARLGAGTLVAGALLLSPFASSLPDGLDWTMQQLNLAALESPSLLAWFRDYQLAGIQHPAISTITAGLIGALCVWGFTMVIAKQVRMAYDQN